MAEYEQRSATHEWIQVLAAWRDLRGTVAERWWGNLPPLHSDGSSEPDLAVRALGQAVRECDAAVARSEAVRASNALELARRDGADVAEAVTALRVLCARLDDAVMADADCAERPWTDLPLVAGHRCRACGGEVRMSPGGAVCARGHGGAEEPGTPTIPA